MQYIPEFMLPMMNSDPGNMEYFLRVMEEKEYGKLLCESGLKEETKERIRRQMICR